MPKGRVTRGKTWVFDPHSGGKPIPAATQDVVRQRILDYAQKHYAGKFARIDVRFRGAICYIDAYKEPPPDSEQLAKICRVPPAEYVEGFRNTPTHLADCATLTWNGGASRSSHTATRNTRRVSIPTANRSGQSSRRSTSVRST